VVCVFVVWVFVVCVCVWCVCVVCVCVVGVVCVVCVCCVCVVCVCVVCVCVNEYFSLSHSMWQGLCNGMVSVCLPHLSTATAVCSGFAAVGPEGRRY